jgi:hypothetical protein
LNRLQLCAAETNAVTQIVPITKAQYLIAETVAFVHDDKPCPHAFKIHSSEVHMLVLMTPGGFMNASATMAIPAQSLVIPPDDGITYATVDLYQTIRVFEKYGVRFLAPEAIALELPAFPLCPSH